MASQLFVEHFQHFFPTTIFFKLKNTETCSFHQVVEALTSELSEVDQWHKTGGKSLWVEAAMTQQQQQQQPQQQQQN